MKTSCENGCCARMQLKLMNVIYVTSAIYCVTQKLKHFTLQLDIAIMCSTCCRLLPIAAVAFNGLFFNIDTSTSVTQASDDTAS